MPAKASGGSLWQSVGSLPGKGGATSRRSPPGSTPCASSTRGLTLREIIVQMLESSGLVDFYKTDREGKERLENLEELINAAEAFVTQEGFGKDAVALPVDEVAATSGIGRFGSSAGRAEFTTPGAEILTDGQIIAPARTRSRRRDRRDPVAARPPS